MGRIVYQAMRLGEESAVCEMVAQVFHELVAPDYDQEGIEEFFSFVNPIRMAKRIHSGGFVFVARQSGKPVGALELVPPDRIALLFVVLRKQGIAKELLARAIEKARSENPALSRLTVHSSPYAAAVYQKMRFRRTGHATTEHGIRYIPMELPLDSTDA